MYVYFNKKVSFLPFHFYIIKFFICCIERENIISSSIEVAFVMLSVFILINFFSSVHSFTVAIGQMPFSYFLLVSDCYIFNCKSHMRKKIR